MLRKNVGLAASDHLVRGSVFLMASTVIAASLGFAFWLVTARLYSPAQVGDMTALISATSLISYFALFGLNSAMIRFLPSASDPDLFVSRSVLLVFATASLVATGYATTVPIWSPHLRFLGNSPIDAAAFVALNAFAAVNLLTDSVFIVRRAAQYNAFVDGVVQGSTKIAALPAFTFAGAYGIFLAFGTGAVVAVVTSLVLMRLRLNLRLVARRGASGLRSVLGYSLGTYTSSLLNLFPLLVLPLIVLQVRGAAEAGYYFVAFQIANLLNAVSYAVGEALFSEGSHSPARLRELSLRAGRVLFAIQVPAAVIVLVASQRLLAVFGGNYSRHGGSALRVLALASLAVALNTWASFILKSLMLVRAMIMSNVVYAAAIVGIAVVGSHVSLAWVALGWLIGNLLSGGVAAWFLWREGLFRNPVFER